MGLKLYEQQDLNLLYLDHDHCKNAGNKIGYHLYPLH